MQNMQSKRYKKDAATLLVSVFLELKKMIADHLGAQQCGDKLGENIRRIDSLCLTWFERFWQADKGI